MAGSPKYKIICYISLKTFNLSFLPGSHLISNDRLNSLNEIKLSSKRRSNPFRSRKHNGPAIKKIDLSLHCIYTIVFEKLN